MSNRVDDLCTSRSARSCGGFWCQWPSWFHVFQLTVKKTAEGLAFPYQIRSVFFDRSCFFRFRLHSFNYRRNSSVPVYRRRLLLSASLLGDPTCPFSPPSSSSHHRIHPGSRKVRRRKTTNNFSQSLKICAKI